MRGFLFVQIVLMLSGFALGQDAAKDQKPKNAKDIAVACMLLEPDRLLKDFFQAKDQLARAKAKNANVRLVADCEQRILRLEKKLAEAKVGDIAIPQLLNPDDEGSLEDCCVGKAGLIVLRSPPYNYSMEAKIYQIIDKDRMLVSLEQNFQSFRDLQHYTHTKIVLVKMPTAGHADNQKLSFDHPVVVTGTYQYEATLGTKTVFVFEQIDPDLLKAEVKKSLPPSTVKRIEEVLATAEAERQSERKAEADRQAAAEQAVAERNAKTAEKKAADEKASAEREAAIEKAKWHTWTNSSGEFKIEAKFGGMAGGIVKLIKKDGSAVRVPLEKLSDEDKRLIKSKSH